MDFVLEQRLMKTTINELRSRHPRLFVAGVIPCLITTGDTRRLCLLLESEAFLPRVRRHWPALLREYPLLGLSCEGIQVWVGDRRVSPDDDWIDGGITPSTSLLIAFAVGLLLIELLLPGFVLVAIGTTLLALSLNHEKHRRNKSNHRN